MIDDGLFTARESAIKPPPMKHIAPRAENRQSHAPIDINDATALKALAMEALVEIVQKAPRNVSLVAAIRELIDRIEGKAPQSIALDVKDTRMDKMPIERLLKLAALLDEPVLISPLPKN